MFLRNNKKKLILKTDRSDKESRWRKALLQWKLFLLWTLFITSNYNWTTCSLNKGTAQGNSLSGRNGCCTLFLEIHIFCNENPFASKLFSHSWTGIDHLVHVIRVLLRGIRSGWKWLLLHTILRDSCIQYTSIISNFDVNYIQWHRNWFWEMIGALFVCVTKQKSEHLELRLFNSRSSKLYVKG